MIKLDYAKKEIKMNSICEIQQDSKLAFQLAQVDLLESGKLTVADGSSSTYSVAVPAILSVGAVFTLIGSAVLFSIGLPTGALLLAVAGVALTIFAMTSGMSGTYTNSRPVVFDRRPAVLNRWDRPDYIYRDSSYYGRTQPLHLNLNTTPRRSGREHNLDQPAVVNLQTRDRYANHSNPVYLGRHVNTDRPVLANLGADVGRNNRTRATPVRRPASTNRPARADLERGHRPENLSRFNQTNQRQAPARSNLSGPSRRVNPARSATGRGNRSESPNIVNLNRSNRRRAV